MQLGELADGLSNRSHTLSSTVGQRFILHLHDHPFFNLVALGASSRSAGHEYSAVTRWKQSKPIPESVQRMVVQECTTANFKHCDIVFSGLDHDVAGPIGGFFSQRRRHC